MTEGTVLRSGCAPWLRQAHAGLGVLALLSLLAQGDDPAWTVGAVALLVLAQRIAASRTRAPGARGRLHLASDDSALLFTPRGLRAARLLPGAWVSGALCVLPLEDRATGARFHCILCRSQNAPKPWRRLQARLRAPNPARGPAPGRSAWL